LTPKPQVAASKIPQSSFQPMLAPSKIRTHWVKDGKYRAYCIDYVCRIFSDPSCGFGALPIGAFFVFAGPICGRS
jgi:hypothetical protein